MIVILHRNFHFQSQTWNMFFYRKGDWTSTTQRGGWSRPGPLRRPTSEKVMKTKVMKDCNLDETHWQKFMWTAHQYIIIYVYYNYMCITHTILVTDICIHSNVTKFWIHLACTQKMDTLGISRFYGMWNPEILWDFARSKLQGLMWLDGALTSNQRP